MKKFNTTAVCIPSKHYMVDISDKVEQIKKLVDGGMYFTINRARQYGKTTTLTELKKLLLDEYTVISLDFQGIDADVFKNGSSFAQGFSRLIIDLHEFEDVPVPDKILESFEHMNEKSNPPAMLGRIE